VPGFAHSPADGTALGHDNPRAQPAHSMSGRERSSARRLGRDRRSLLGSPGVSGGAAGAAEEVGRKARDP
jgi:hypothetical protein